MFSADFIFWNAVLTVAWAMYKMALNDFGIMSEWCARLHRIVDVREYYKKGKRDIKVEFSE